MAKIDSNAVLTVPEPGIVEMKERPYPSVKPESVLVMTEIVAVCVDDRIYTDHVHEWFDHSLNGCGHEVVGTVVDAPESLVFKRGDRVSMTHRGRSLAYQNGLSQARCESKSGGLRAGSSTTAPELFVKGLASLEHKNESESGWAAFAECRLIDERIGKPKPEAIRAQLKRILQSAEFRASDKQRKFLSFVVEETLEGRGSRLKGFTIAVAVYGRTKRFDPQVDPIVRVEAGRLRRALERYYLTAGINDPVRIGIPKGGYVPSFHTVQISPSGVESHTSEREDGALSAGPSIAVMPLINLTGDREQEYFADGLTEELTAELTRYQEFRVIASQSTMRFKGQEVNPKEVGGELGVRFLLTGSVRKGLQNVKVAIRLVDTSTAEQIWEESYKRVQTAADLIAVQEEIANSVIGAIADQYGSINRRLSRESRKKAPADLKAYDAILRFYHYETVLTPVAFQKALAALEQAIEIDPEYGLAWAMLGHLHADNYALGFCEIEASLEKALTFAQKGVALSPHNQFAQDVLTLVHFHRGDKDFFLQQAEQTIALNPNSPYVVGVAGWHMMLYGEWDRGLTLLKKGMKLNPYYPSWFHLAPFMDYYRRGEYENALAEALKFNFPELFWDPLMRAAALGQLGKQREAKTAVRQLLKLVPDFATQGRWLISRYVKVDELIDTVLEGLRTAGLADIE